MSPPLSQSPEPPDILQAPEPPSPIRQMKIDLQDQENARLEKFGKLLAGPTTDLGKTLLLLCCSCVKETPLVSHWFLGCTEDRYCSLRIAMFLL